MFDFKTITSYEAACKDQDRDPNARPDYSKCGMTPTQEKYHMSGFEYDIISTSVNKDENGNEWKPAPGDLRYYLWLRIVKDKTKCSGFGLSFNGFACDASFTCVPSRLTFRSRDRAIYMFENYPELFEDLFIPQF